MSNFSVVNPADIPAIALPSMDATHHEEVELVNQIGELIKAGQAGVLDHKGLQAKLDEWVEHTRAHFAAENQLMETANFPAYTVHSAAHTQALDGLTRQVDTWRSGEDLDGLANYVFTLWPEWLLVHVSSMDTMTALYLSQHQSINAQAQA